MLGMIIVEEKNYCSVVGGRRVGSDSLDDPGPYPNWAEKIFMGAMLSDCIILCVTFLKFESNGNAICQV
jgi:hypothetical protein